MKAKEPVHSHLIEKGKGYKAVTMSPVGALSVTSQTEVREYIVSRRHYWYFARIHPRLQAPRSCSAVSARVSVVMVAADGRFLVIAE